MKSWLKIGALVLMLAFIAGAMSPALANIDEYLQELTEIQKQIRELEAQEKKAKDEMTKVELELKKLKLILDDARNRLARLNEQIAEQEVQIEEQENAIAAKEQEIAETEAYLAEQTGYMEQRLRIMYKNGAVSYLEVLFSATSFPDFLSRLKFLGAIIDSDARLINEVKETRDWLTREKAALEEELELLVARKEKLEADRAAAKAEEEKVASLVAAQQDKRSQLEKSVAKLKAARGELDKRQAELEQDIKRYYDSKEWQDGEAPEVFCWPVPVTRYVSSPFGWRTLYGQPNWHRGIDIAPSHIYWPGSSRYQGTPAYILAAAPGTVVISKYHASYGYYVMIAHGGGYATLYAHMHTSPMVKVGDQVTIGQKLGIVGSTGESFGPHLHFEVRINNEPVDPLIFSYFDF